jgi:uncharacterized repeat protein (TIGR03803 family)
MARATINLRRQILRNLFAASLVAGVAAAAPVAADAAAADAPAALTTLYSFVGPPDGGNPIGGLISDNTGALYGTTNGGGFYNSGAVFKLTPPSTAGGAWTESVLYSFCSQTNCSDGDAPFAGLISDASGALYGTTTFGGSPVAPFAGGTVFKLTPPSTAGGAWTESVLYNFCSQANCSDGGEPFAGLIMDASGALYGTTLLGGSPPVVQGVGPGTVFKLTPPSTAGGAWTERVLYSFCSQNNCSDGVGLQAGLISDASGALYGTTGGGGSAAAGTVFKLTPPSTGAGAWTESVLYSFCSQANCSDGSGPHGLISDASGALYGTTTAGGKQDCSRSYGCGIVFKLTPPAAAGGSWSESVLHSFTGSDGAEPFAGLIMDAAGALYGTSSGGFGFFDVGTVFRLTPPATAGGAWTESVLYFSGIDGASPEAGLIMDASGALYGTAAGGANTSCEGGCGTVFKTFFFSGAPGQPNCVGNSVSALAQKYVFLTKAAVALGYPSVQALQSAIAAYCMR